ncbi:unnamed protein product [Heligmosomoides polygyrus]|uniref:HTH_48 domain-containing protein n=1 Tax=Heligmosomoides polygyrus TaxID=6339 RepID=A0A183G7Q0_HELPZ|nr:unnamed protein product [Heligmosomoides polygyrus]
MVRKWWDGFESAGYPRRHSRRHHGRVLDLATFSSARRASQALTQAAILKPLANGEISEILEDNFCAKKILALERKTP